jgi:hypothetical protein
MSPSDVFCSSCGARNDPDAVFCSSCGARLATAPPPPPPVEKVSPPPPPVAAVRAPAKKGNPLPLLLAVGAIVILLLVVLVEAALILLPQGPAAGAEAIVSALQGQTLLQKGGQGDWMEVVGSVAVEAGDRIRTSDASYAVLNFMEGTTTDLGALTELRIGELEVAPGKRVVIKLDLELGEVWNRIAELPADSVHEISTLAATVTCHGSQYGLSVDETGTTWVRGQDGRVEVTAGGSTVPVASGDTLMVELGSAPVSYASVAMVPTAPAGESSEGVASQLEGADMPTFLNQPLPTGTPTNTPPPTSTPRPAPSPTATRKPQPTATPRGIDCPTITIREPSRAPARGPFGIEFDRNPAKPGSHVYVVEFRQPGGSWLRAEPVPANVTKRGQYWMADLRAPGEGEWQWRICLARASDPYGEAVCCSATKQITHASDEPCST